VVIMTTNIWNRGAVLVAFGVLLGAGLDNGWRYAVTPVTAAMQRQTQPQPPQPQAQAPRADALPTMESLPREVAQLKALVPSNSHIMMDVQWHWTNLWFAGKRRNWPLAQYYFNESRGHIQQLVRKNPTIRNNAEQKDVDLVGIFDGIDTSSLAMVKDAIEKKDGPGFDKNYRIMLESCYACHKSVGRPYIRPQIPTAQVQQMVNMDPNATWPQ
jgi:hypothetical protein